MLLPLGTLGAQLVLPLARPLLELGRHRLHALLPRPDLGLGPRQLLGQPIALVLHRVQLRLELLRQPLVLRQLRALLGRRPLVEAHHPGGRPERVVQARHLRLGAAQLRLEHRPVELATRHALDEL